MMWKPNSTLSIIKISVADASSWFVHRFTPAPQQSRKTVSRLLTASSLQADQQQKEIKWDSNEISHNGSNENCLPRAVDAAFNTVDY